MTPAELVTLWRGDAEKLVEYGDRQIADVARRHADQLDAALSDHADEGLTLAQAARESGYSASRLRHLVAGGGDPQRRPSRGA